jgi:hypothetical protein
VVAADVNPANNQATTDLLVRAPLPATGSPALPLAGAGLGLILLGFLLTGVARRVCGCQAASGSSGLFAAR